MEKKIEFTFKEILEDIISQEIGGCRVADRARFWLKKLEDSDEN